jgi:predicted HicB family RNase H-like nuclease
MGMPTLGEKLMNTAKAWKKEDKVQRGGRRSGAGRPRLGKRQVKLMLSPQIYAQLARAAKVAGVSKCEFAEAAIQEKVKRLG